MGVCLQLDRPQAAAVRIDAHGGIQQVHFQQVVVADVQPAVVQQALHLPQNRRQVGALVHVIHVKAVLLHLLHQILRGVAVVPHLQRVKLPALHQLAEPGKAVVIIDKAFPRGLQQPPPHIHIIRQVIPRLGVGQPRRGQKEPRQHMQPSVLFHHHAAGRQIRGARQVNAAHAIAAAQLFQPDGRAAGLFHRLRADPRLAAVLADVAVFGQKLRFGGQALAGDGQLLLQIGPRHGDPQIGVCLGQLGPVVPLFHIVDLIQQRQQTLFAAVAQQQAGTAAQQLVIHAVAGVAAGAQRQQQRLPSAAAAAFQHVVLPQARLARPAGDLVADGQVRVIPIALFGAERDLLHRAVGLRHVIIAFAPPGQVGQLRLGQHRLPKAAVHDVRLIQLRGHAIDLRAVLAVQIQAAGHDGGGQQRFAVLAPHHQHHLAEIAPAVRLHQPEDQRQRGLLPQLQLQQVAAPARMVAEALDKADGAVGLFRIQPVFARRAPGLDALIQQPHPPPDGDAPFLHGAAVFADVIIHPPGCPAAAAPAVRRSSPAASARSAGG